MIQTEYDVLIIGAGLSGISAGYHLQTHCPNRTYAILEAREAIGGTWDLFRYPGIRSDSDMYTLGYHFQPWTNPQDIADGASILSYIQDTAVAHGIDQKIHFNHRVTTARWSSTNPKWHLTMQTNTGKKNLTCQFLFACSGYYDYKTGHTPTWLHMDQFQGDIIHPQHWPQNLDYTDKKIIVIGSGATAVTLVPALSQKASHVTMLQRSPTYIVSLPSHNQTSQKLRQRLPQKTAHQLIRAKHIFEGIYTYQLAKRFPNFVKKIIRRLAQKELPPNFPIDTHLNPRYNPWDQRLCFIPDGDLFQAINSGKADIVTAHIDHFTPTGITLDTGQTLTADLIITATGLKVQLAGGIALFVDDEPINFGQKTTYRGAMFNDIPNFAYAFGYTNASWTLKCELIAQYVCRLLNHMAQNNYQQCTPRLDQADPAAKPAIDLTAGYIQRVQAHLPQQGTSRPWLIYQNYLKDLINFRHSRLQDGTMHFS